MPDISKQTVSASQMPAIFNQSPYATRWMMWKHFAKGMPVDHAEDERMSWGKRVEPVILAEAADRLRCEILPHDQLVYLRSPHIPIGCTPDGYVLDPNRGLGFIEVKNIDWLRWRDTWEETRAAEHVEIQMQTQLMVPHPELGLPKWGCIAALVGGNELKLYERPPIAAVHDQIAFEATNFLDSVEGDFEPDVLGREIELPALTALYPKSTPDLVLTEKDFDLPESVRVARLIEEYEFAKDRESSGKKTAANIKAELLSIAKDASAIILHGRFLNIARWDVGAATIQRKASTTVKMTATIQNLAADLDAILPPVREAKIDNIFSELDQ